MIFTEGRFFVLFLVCFAVYWSLASDRWRKPWLLLCSAVFYGAWDARFLALMYATLTMDWAIGLVLARDRPAGGRKLWLVLSLLGNLGALGFFKYWNFFVDSAVVFTHWLGLPIEKPTLSIVLPVGVSFYTFQSLSYTIDVYRRGLPATRSWRDFALFVTFFPQLVAGPIVRAAAFLPQLVRRRRWSDVRVRAALLLFLFGFVKKACIADQVSGTVDAVFQDPTAFGWGAHWTAVALYAVQIYCDFSGYSDMAIACAGLLGYQLTLNFDFPYLAGDIAQFWRRWHISLSTWFRDYLYIPLGGSRISPGRTYLNLSIVFFLCGLWHGASWHFVLWGLMHGIFLGIHRVWSERVPAESRLARTGSGAGWALTPLAVLLAWVVFRARDCASAWKMWMVMLGLETGGPAGVSGLWWALLAALFALHLASRKKLFAPLERFAPDWAFAAGYGAAVALILPWVASGTKPFIYFQF